MPELPEVETVRRGLAAHLPGRRVTAVSVAHPRAVRRHAAGAADLAARLTGAVAGEVHRRGKYLWLPLRADDGRLERLVAHLGMSGQLLLGPPGRDGGPHLRAVLALSGRGQDGPLELYFADQRTFGGLFLADPAGGDPQTPDADAVPSEIVHIAPDPLGDQLTAESLWQRLHVRRSTLKRTLLDQTVLSGVGNIYADEALWRAQLNPERSTRTLSRREVARLLDGLREVMTAALGAGGTSFDSLYTDVNGRSGRYDTSLHAYGRDGTPCDRCGTLIVRTPFANRSSHWCPHCQPRPRGQAPTRVPDPR